MMAPDPDMRPTVESILLDPKYAAVLRLQDKNTVNKGAMRHSMPVDYKPKFNDENSHPNLIQQPTLFNSEAKSIPARSRIE